MTWERVAAVAVSTTAVGFLLGSVDLAWGLTTRSATTSTVGANGLLTATAKCKPGEKVVSGGFTSPDNSYAYVSRAKRASAWTASVEGTAPVEVSAYCSRKLDVSAQSQTKPVPGPAGTRVNAAARCDSGQSLASGGYAVKKPLLDVHDLVAFQSRSRTSARWGVSVFNDEDSPATLRVFGYCLRDAKVKVRSAQSNPIPNNTTGSAEARCHRNEQLLSGGYVTTPKPDYFNMTGPDFFYFSSARSGARSWKASAHNYSSAAGTITAFAYCKK